MDSQEPQSNQISQPQGGLTPELAWITGDTINLILAGYFYSETITHLFNVDSRLTEDILLTPGTSPFSVVINNKLDNIVPAENTDPAESESDSDFEAGIRNIHGVEAPPPSSSTPTPPVPAPPELGPDTAGHEIQRDNYIFIVE